MPRGKKDIVAAPAVKALQQQLAAALKAKDKADAELAKIPEWALKRKFDASDIAVQVAATRLLRKRAVTLAVFADKMGCDHADALEVLDAVDGAGFSVEEIGGQYRMAKSPPPLPPEVKALTGLSGKIKRIGVVADTHVANVHHRADVLADAYAVFAKRRIMHVMHAGNIIDGYADRINRGEVTHPWLSKQAELLADTYPQNSGRKTYFITGECHEGWYGKVVGDVGRFIQYECENHGRNDLVYAGHMERDVVLQSSNGRAVVRVLHPGGGSAYAMSYRPQKIIECVPMDSEILTPSGWATQSEVAVGDAVMGYDMETGKCAWTQLLAINRGRGEIATYENDNFSVRCTRNHRWVMTRESRGGPNPHSRVPAPYSKCDTTLSTIADTAGDWRRYRIVQAAVCPCGPGWAPVEHGQWLDRPHAVASVLSMTSGQRKSFIYGMMLGEGASIQRSGTLVFSQRPGPVNDAFALACFMEGVAVGRRSTVGTKINGDEKVCCRSTMLRKRMRMAMSMRVGDRSTEDVWCPTTALGTWVMRQGGTITITGNSLQGGEKPHVLLCGHFHKMGYFVIRNVHCVLCGCTEDQTRFMRKKSIEAHLGFTVVEIEQDQQGGIRRLIPEMHHFFDRGYHIEAPESTVADALVL